MGGRERYWCQSIHEVLEKLSLGNTSLCKMNSQPFTKRGEENPKFGLFLRKKLPKQELP